MPDLTTAELLADLARDGDLSGTVANLEAGYLAPLEAAATDPALLDAVLEARSALARAALALRRLTLVEALQGNRLP
jgi:hypothetical protein